MALRKKGKFSYGDTQADLHEELLKYSKKNGYPISHFKDVKCTCGGKLFHLQVDDTEGAAIRYCKKCGDEHPIGDSDEFLADANLEDCECPCGSGFFQITAGVALYDDSEDVKWLYLGCRCPDCGLVACYGDWKNEYIGYQDLLKRV